MTERIELVAHSLFQGRNNNQQMILEISRGEVNRTVSRTLKSHLKKHFESSKVNPRQVDPIFDGVGPSQTTTDIGTVSESRRCRPEIEDAIPPKTGLKHSADKWIKKSFNESRRDLIRKTTFGTLSIQTKTIWYIRETDRGPHPNTKEVSTTTLTFLPSPWLMSQGVILRHQKFHIFRRCR